MGRLNGQAYIGSDVNDADRTVDNSDTASVSHAEPGLRLSLAARNDINKREKTEGMEKWGKEEEVKLWTAVVKSIQYIG